MSLFGLHVLTDEQYEALKAAGHRVETFAVTEAEKAVLALKGTEIGTAVANNISAVENHDLSGAEKFAAVLANTLPLVLKYVSGGGVDALVKDVEDIGRALVQSVFNDVKSTSAGKIGAEILDALGID